MELKEILIVEKELRSAYCGLVLSLLLEAGAGASGYYKILSAEATFRRVYIVIQSAQWNGSGICGA